MPRARQDAAQSLSEEEGSSSQSNSGMALGRAGAKSRPSMATGGRRKSAGTEIPPEVLQCAAQVNRNPRRTSSAAVAKPLSSDQDEDDESGAGSDFGAYTSRAPPKKAVSSSKKPARVRKKVAPASETAPASKGKGNAKAKAAVPPLPAENGHEPVSSGSLQSEFDVPPDVLRMERVDRAPPGTAPASSPSKQNGLSAPEAFGSQSLVTGRATRQTAEERKAGWNILYFPRGRPIWVHVRKERRDGFWWPGEASL